MLEADLSGEFSVDRGRTPSGDKPKHQYLALIGIRYENDQI